MLTQTPPLSSPEKISNGCLFVKEKITRCDVLLLVFSFSLLINCLFIVGLHPMFYPSVKQKFSVIDQDSYDLTKNVKDMHGGSYHEHGDPTQIQSEGESF